MEGDDRSGVRGEVEEDVSELKYLTIVYTSYLVVYSENQGDARAVVNDHQ